MGMLSCLTMRKHKEQITELLQECLSVFNNTEADLSPYLVYKRLDEFCKEKSTGSLDVEIHLRSLIELYVDQYVLTF